MRFGRLLLASKRRINFINPSRFTVPSFGRRKIREQRDILNRNRYDPSLEKAAREGKLLVPLSTVHDEWKSHCGLAHLERAGEHFNLFKDLYGKFFRPLGFMGVAYEEARIDRGNLVYPKQVLNQPDIKFPSLQDHHHKQEEDKPLYWTLVMTNPDGHILNNELEILHWMITNISVDGNLSSGEVLYPYLAPLPPQGTGVHRIIFSLYYHRELLTHSPMKVHGSWLEQRTFSTLQFLQSCPRLSPYTFSFFQTLWDQSVQETFRELGVTEPIYQLEKKETAHQLIEKAVKKARSQKFKDLLAMS